EQHIRRQKATSNIWEMIQFCAQFVDEVNKNLPQPVTKEQYIESMRQNFPMLKRWRSE
ncbi:MAG: hypothetical protein II676_05855, partial [Bacteroidales bacterium]|nr:hypothetical protein [Bacteroidales bacterium]